jgi:hypothetical protein
VRDLGQDSEKMTKAKKINSEEGVRKVRGEGEGRMLWIPGTGKEKF